MSLSDIEFNIQEFHYIKNVLHIGGFSVSEYRESFPAEIKSNQQQETIERLSEAQVCVSERESAAITRVGGSSSKSEIIPANSPV